MTAQTYQGARLYISPTVQTATLNQAGFEALSNWVQITKIVTMPSFTISDNMLTENYLDTDISEKQKGFRQAADSELVIGFDDTNAGHTSLIGFAQTKSVYPVYRELDNSLGTSGSISYALALIGGGGDGGGAGEDFVRRTFQFALTRQFPIEVAAS